MLRVVLFVAAEHDQGAAQTTRKDVERRFDVVALKLPGNVGVQSGEALKGTIQLARLGDPTVRKQAAEVETSDAVAPVEGRDAYARRDLQRATARNAGVAAQPQSEFSDAGEFQAAYGGRVAKRRFEAAGAAV